MQASDADNRRRVHSFGDDALGTLDATALAAAIKAGQVSVQEVTEAAIARAERMQSLINGIEVHHHREALENHSGASSGAGCFAGVPTYIKDNTPVRGFPTRHGSRAVTPMVADEHGPYAEQFLSLGFRTLGKSRLPEFGFNATTEPEREEPTRNPWNLDYSCGASSGGAAALVAAGVVPIAHANDGGGSIRIPAACCGLIGLKPSRGRHVNSTQAKLLPINIISEGVVTRSMRDTALFHSEAERYYRSSNLPVIGRVTGGSPQRRRIGLVLDSVTGFSTDNESREAVEKVGHLLQAEGHRVEMIALPIDSRFPNDFGLYWALLAYLTYRTGKLSIDISFDGRKMDGLSQGLIQRFKKEYYRVPGALHRLQKSIHDYQGVFKHYDVILSPVLGHTTPPIGHIRPDIPFKELFSRLTKYVSFTPLANITGAPALSFPVGLDQNGLPLSVQLSGPVGGERRLLELGYELENLMPPEKIY